MLTQNSRGLKGDMKQISYCGSTNLRNHYAKSGRSGNLVPEICAALPWDFFLKYINYAPCFTVRSHDHGKNWTYEI